MNITALVHAVVLLLVVGLVFWLLWWLISYIAPPEPFAKIARCVLAIFGVLILIGVLLSLVGHPVVAW
jgi:hypothetical protein